MRRGDCDLVFYSHGVSERLLSLLVLSFVFIYCHMNKVIVCTVTAFERELRDWEDQNGNG